MSKCVNLSSREFRDCCKRLNVSASSLEPIIHEYINIKGNENSFPSDVYINNKLNGRSIAVLADEQIQLWEKRYSQPKQFNNSSDALTYFNEVNKFFPKEAIGIKQTLGGKYEVRVAEPFKSDELEDIKKKAIADGTFMNAPNGNSTNLTENQWLHVRTKAFKRWFGDWENDPENASKVVDENGEPLVVYHESSYKFDTFDSSKKRYDVHKEKAFWFSKVNRKGEGYGENIYPVFLNVRNPNISTWEDKKQVGLEGLRPLEDRLLKDENSDGLITDTYDKFGREVQYAVKNSNQIKSATDNVGTYSRENNNIYYQTTTDENIYIEFLTNDNLNEFGLELDKEYTINDILKILPEINSPISKDVIVELLKASSKVGIKYVFEIGPDNKTFGMSEGMKIHLYSSPSNPYFVHSLIHETIHSFLAYAIDNPNSDLITKKQKKAIKELQKIFEFVKNEDVDNRFGALNDIQEFIAELANPNVYNKLKEFKKPYKKENIFTKLWHTLLDFLGLSKTLNTEVENILKTFLVSPSVYKELQFRMTSSQNKETFYFKEDVDDHIEELLEDGISRDNIIVEYTPETEENDYYWTVIVKNLGENISSKGSEFAKQLTNPGNTVEVVYKGTRFRNAEHAYQTWKSGEFDESAYKNESLYPKGIKPVNKSTNYQTMVEILTAKLQQHPELIEGINSRGGIDYLKNSTHSVKGDKYWESSGKNKFIEALIDAYNIVSSIKEIYIENDRPIIMYRGYALTENREANTIDETVGHTAVDYNENLKGSIYFTSSAEEAEEYSTSRTDTSEEEFYNSKGEFVRQRNRHYTGNYGKVSSYYIKEGAVVKHFKDIKDYNKNGNNSKADVIVLDQGTMWGGVTEYIVRNPSVIVSTKSSELSPEELVEREENIQDYQNTYNVSREEAEKEIDAYLNNSTAKEVSEKSKTEDARKKALNNTHQEQLRINEQINNITKSGIINKAEVTELAYDIVYTMSDFLTKWQYNPESIIEDLGKHGINFNPKDVARIKNLSRGELVHLIGAGNVLNFIKEECFGEEYDDGTLSEEEYDLLEDKKLLLYENFEAVMQFGISAFATIEDFSLSFSEAGYIVSEHDEDNNSSDQSNEEIHAAEENGDKQEHWQVDSKTIDNILSMSQIVKRELVRLYDIHEVTVDGETVVEPKKNLYGMNKRIDPRNATYSILRWTEGALTLPKMIERLQAKAKDNIWLSILLEKLTDTSGRYSDFQSQFFTTFCKHFQDYYIVKEQKKEDGSKVKMIMPVNRNPVLRQTIKDIETLYNIQSHPLFTSKGLKADAYDKLKRAYEKLANLNKQPFDSLNKEQLIKGIQFVSEQLGYAVSKEDIEAVLNEQVFNTLLKELQPIVNNLGKGLNNSTYNPFGDFKDGGIKGNLRNFLKPLVENKEAINADSVYDSGKMYQSRIIPSWLSKTMDKFLTLEGKEYQDFLEEEYGKYEWFRNTSVPISNKASWINPWLKRLAGMSLEERKKIFGHHVQLNYLGHNYMRNMSEPEYILSVLTAFNSGEKDATKVQTAWYKIPMMSNKPSLEFIKFEKYSQDRIATELLNIFAQEVKRIKTVTARGYKKGDPQFIKNFDGKRGKSFVFLDYLNDYLPGGKSTNTELGKRLKAKLEGDKIESWTDENGKIYNDENALNECVKREIINFMTKKTESIIESYKSNGVYEVCKTITGVGTTDTAVNDFLTSFVWNDTFASINILELTIGDMAYYANAEDVQKRLAQIHAPGLKGNMFALDYGEYDAEGNMIREAQQVCDGNLRTIFLEDYEGEAFKQNIIENLEIVFDKKITQAEGVAKEYWTNLKKNIIHQFKTQINVADAQAYNCPTSYRKKALMFGKWSQRSEEIYQKLIKGEANISDIETAFQPLKPFVYTNVHKHSNAGEMTNLKVGMQFKNSEYLLIMADALLRGEDTGKPNMLRALFDVMEDSVKYTITVDKEGNINRTPKTDRTKGIDSFQFASAVKAGLQGTISLKDFIDKGGNTKEYIESLIYNENGEYVETRVHTFPAEDYSIQQEVPKHFMEHSQAHGSQERMIIPSDLALKDDKENDVVFTYTHPDGTVEEWKASEFRSAYEHNIAEGIEESIKALEEELGLNFTDPDAKKLRNIALSQILQKEILSSPRYGIDLYLACGVNSKGEFNIPLGDPIQSKRVEQLINSIIKNRVNKQKVAGGPVVQVSNFGMSERLHIRFKPIQEKDWLANHPNATTEDFKKFCKDNGIVNGVIPTLDEWLNLENNKGKKPVDFSHFLKECQAGIAYYECYAPAYMKEFLTDFMDENGNVDIEAVEAVNPEMLEMIGYRIPTEDAYSIAPLRIKGFLPKEAGEGIVMPYEIVLITGSDIIVVSTSII